MSEIFSPFLNKLGVGGIGGFFIGYAIKKIVKLLAIILGFFVLALSYLGYTGVISINYEKLIDVVSKVLPYDIPNLLPIMINNLPFSGSFVVGFSIGLKKG